MLPRDVASVYLAGAEVRQAKPDANNGDEEGDLAALALAEVYQRGGSPQVSQASGRSSGQMFLSPGKSIDRKNADSEMGSSKMHGFQVEDYPEDELSALDALHTLADISVNILQPSSIAESG
ncbi:protein ALWAYS EARLY 2 [Hordeum vulgare]|nr:protein ALWAYS EARLY 2 [Hordeum vulgare]